MTEGCTTKTHGHQYLSLLSPTERTITGPTQEIWKEVEKNQAMPTLRGQDASTGKLRVTTTVEPTIYVAKGNLC